MAQWYLLRKRRHVGPYSPDELRRKYSRHQLRAADFVLSEDKLEKGEFHYIHLSELLALSDEQIQEHEKTRDSETGFGADYSSELSRAFTDSIEAVDLVTQVGSYPTADGASSGMAEEPSVAEVALSKDPIQIPTWKRVLQNPTWQLVGLTTVLMGGLAIWVGLSEDSALSGSTEVPQAQAPSGGNPTLVQPKKVERSALTPSGSTSGLQPGSDGSSGSAAGGRDQRTNPSFSPSPSAFSGSNSGSNSGPSLDPAAGEMDSGGSVAVEEIRRRRAERAAQLKENRSGAEDPLEEEEFPEDLDEELEEDLE